ncbi:MAG TPA: ELM1/GtrOC1 family putative glycosyltransferase [Dongiaceae bacterium]|nr:ELM1/GtrOC1 family putative glycosyltransferase [Dongiaceae bacterium]
MWLLVGDKVGDNAQLEAIVEALGWTCERKHLRFHPRYGKRRPIYRATLSHVDLEGSDTIAPPWPDLVLTVGRRPSMAALWVQQQSGGRTKLVIVGRPHRMLHRFDLIITSTLFHLPDHSNVLKLSLPLMRYNAGQIATAAEEWKEHFADLKRPLTAVLIGGPENPFRFGTGATKRLLEQACNLPGENGSLVIVTSRRTPPKIVEALSTSLPPYARLCRWTSDQSFNPYAALLGLADRFIVTGDSISMMVEVARLRKPLAIVPLPLRRAPWIWLEQVMARRFRSAEVGGSHFWRWLKAFLHGKGIAPFARDIPGFHSMLFQCGLAVPLGQPFLLQAGCPPDGLALAASRIRMLFGLELPAGLEPSEP